MNDCSEKFENNYSPNFIKEIENTYLKSNGSSSFFNNMKTNNNNRNNYIYFSMNNHNISKAQQNYFYFVETEAMNLLSQKSKDIQSQSNQNINLKNEKNRPIKNGSFDSSKENKNIKNINISGEQNTVFQGIERPIFGRQKGVAVFRELIFAMYLPCILINFI